MSDLSSEKLDVLISKTREAGTLALSHFNNVAARRKADHSFVTDADEEIEAMLRNCLKDLFPEMDIIGEEYGKSNEETSASGTWAIDPIDGTESFVKGLPVWGISLGLIQNGIPVAGLFFLPVMDELYIAWPGMVPTRNGDPLPNDITPDIDSESILFVPAFAHRRYRLEFIGKTRSLGSTAAHIAFSADGRGIGALLGRPHIWDIAGTLAVLYHLGGRCMHIDGTPMDFEEILNGGLPRLPLIAGMPDTVEQLSKNITIVSKKKRK